MKYTNFYQYFLSTYVSVRIVRTLAEIRTGYSPNTTLTYYLRAKLLKSETDYGPVCVGV